MVAVSVCHSGPSRLARMSSSPELAGTLSPRELAEKYGLSESSVRPALGDYLRELWSRRFLISGIFVFTFTQRSVMEGTRSISANQSLIRTLHFPRATLPFAYVVNELSQIGISMGILGVLVIVTDGISWKWLLLIPALLLQTMFNIGVTLVFARLGAFHGDIAQIMPFALRTWLYVSGVFFSIPAALASQPGWTTQLIALNPAAVYIDIVRQSML